MIRDTKFWVQWEEELLRREPPEFFRNLRLVEAMLQLARTLGVFPPRDPLEGLDADIRIARILNARSLAGSNRPGA